MSQGEAAESELMSFEAFMSDALHHPERGYYARKIATVGRGGDFTTTAEIAPCLARAIADWLVRMARETGCRHVIELGPGSGKLAHAVRRQLPWHWRWRLHWHLVEQSVPLREKQRALLGSRVTWHHDVSEALACCEGKALVYSNEFFDAFPVRIFRRAQESWQELFVRQSEPMAQEVWCETQELPATSLWQRDWAVGQRVEVHDGVRAWLQGFRSEWRAGAMLTIDYGAECAGMYHRQPHGSIRAYWRQQCRSGSAIYQNPGHQDLTADVNFTDLRDWAGEGEHRIQSQREFLLPWVDADHAGDRYAIDGMGAGQAFQVWQWLRNSSS
jgi:SAM-dependent MidA family methyltransferase